jgi:hypothetical protein
MTSLFKLFEGLLINLFRATISTKFKDRAEYIGTFILVYLGIGGGFLAFCLFLGINPTLIVSVVSAPIWIFLVFLTRRITNKMLEINETTKNL